MDKSLYINEELTQLADDPTQVYKKEIDHIIEETYEMNIITQEIKRALINGHPRTPKDPRHPPGCKVISSIGSILQPIAIYLDSFLQKIVKNLPCCLKGTNDFLQRVNPLSVAGVTWLCTFDVKSLFTNIQVRLYMRHCVWMLLYPTRRLVFWCLCLMLYSLKIISSLGSNSGPFSDKIIVWLRFVDNVFVIWMGTEDKLTCFEESINQIHPLLKFPRTKSQTEVYYLDVKIKIIADRLHTT